MMLRTSLNKLNPTAKLIGFSVRKNIGLTILASIAMLIICPGLVLTRIFDFLENNLRAYDFGNVTESMILWITAAASIGVVLLNILNFSYLFSKKSSDVFHSVPLKRGELLFARAFSGIINVIVPVFIGYLSMLGIILFMPNVVGEILPLIIGFAYTITAMLFCSAFSLIFIICAGTAFDWAVSFFGINIGSMLVATILLDFCYDNLKGYYPTSTTDLFRYISPPYFLFEGITKYVYDEAQSPLSIIIHFAVCIVLTVIFYLISTALYKKRPAEKGGDSFAFRFIYIICSLLVGFCCGYALGIIFGNDETTPIFYTLAAIGAILSCVVYGAITDRGFKKVKGYILTGIVSFAILAVTFLSISFDIFGFSKRIPEAEKIEYVSIGIDSTEVIYDDPSLALDIHKAVYDKDFEDGYDNSVKLTYKLKNGLTMTRKFWYESKQIEDLLLRYAKSEERIKNIEQQIEGAYEHFDVDYQFTDIEAGKFEPTYAYIKINKEQMKQIFALYKKELKSAEKYSANRDYDANFSYNIMEKYGFNYEFFGLNISEDFPETRKLLDELYKEYRVTSDDEKI